MWCRQKKRAWRYGRQVFHFFEKIIIIKIGSSSSSKGFRLNGIYIHIVRFFPFLFNRREHPCTIFIWWGVQSLCRPVVGCRFFFFFPRPLSIWPQTVVVPYRTGGATTTILTICPAARSVIYTAGQKSYRGRGEEEEEDTEAIISWAPILYCVYRWIFLCVLGPKGEWPLRFYILRRMPRLDRKSVPAASSTDALLASSFLALYNLVGPAVTRYHRIRSFFPITFAKVTAAPAARLATGRGKCMTTSKNCVTIFP